MDYHGEGARFKQGQIDHSRQSRPEVGIPRYPGRPDRSRDAMPRQRQEKPKPNIPSWALGLAQAKPPQWALNQIGNRAPNLPQQTMTAVQTPVEQRMGGQGGYGQGVVPPAQVNPQALERVQQIRNMQDPNYTGDESMSPADWRRYAWGGRYSGQADPRGITQPGIPQQGYAQRGIPPQQGYAQPPQQMSPEQRRLLQERALELRARMGRG